MINSIHYHLLFSHNKTVFFFNEKKNNFDTFYYLSWYDFFDKKMFSVFVLHHGVFRTF